MAIATPCNEVDCAFPKCDCWDKKSAASRLIVKQQERITELEQQLADCERLTLERASSIEFIPKCLDPHHDDRWCPHCSSMDDGIEQYQQAIRALIKE